MKGSIDLLPSKPLKQKTMPYLALFSIILLVGAASLLTYSYMSGRQEVERLEEAVARETDWRNDLQIDYGEKRNGITSYTFATTYKTTTAFMNTLYIDTISIKEGLYALLPKNAKVTSYTYANSGSVTMTIVFRTKADAADFLQRVVHAPFVTKAVVDVVSTTEEGIGYEGFFRIEVSTLAGESP